MPGCARCGQPTVRKRRNLLQKVFSRAVYRCEHCRKNFHVRRPLLRIFRRYAECPQCGTRELSRLASKDHVDRMSRNPLRRILKLLGAPLYHCTFCRLQFRDWRKRHPGENNSFTATPAA
jgi:putative FmdB family regulatory protein